MNRLSKKTQIFAFIMILLAAGMIIGTFAVMDLPLYTRPPFPRVVVKKISEDGENRNAQIAWGGILKRYFITWSKKEEEERMFLDLEGNYTKHSNRPIYLSELYESGRIIREREKISNEEDDVICTGKNSIATNSQTCLVAYQWEKLPLEMLPYGYDDVMLFPEAFEGFDQGSNHKYGVNIYNCVTDNTLNFEANISRLFNEEREVTDAFAFELEEKRILRDLLPYEDGFNLFYFECVSKLLFWRDYKLFQLLNEDGTLLIPEEGVYEVGLDFYPPYSQCFLYKRDTNEYISFYFDPQISRANPFWIDINAVRLPEQSNICEVYHLARIYENIPVIDQYVTTNVAYTGPDIARYGIVWGSNWVYFLIVDEYGNIDMNTELILDTDPISVSEATHVVGFRERQSICYNDAREEFVVAWQEKNSEDGMIDISIKRYDTNGNELGNKVVLTELNELKEEIGDGNCYSPSLTCHRITDRWSVSPEESVLGLVFYYSPESENIAEELGHIGPTYRTNSVYFVSIRYDRLIELSEIDENTPPEIVMPFSSAYTAEATKEKTILIRVSDPDDGEELSYEFKTVSGEHLPEAKIITLDERDTVHNYIKAEIRWVPPMEYLGNNNVVLTVRDRDGATDNKIFRIYVRQPKPTVDVYIYDYGISDERYIWVTAKVPSPLEIDTVSLYICPPGSVILEEDFYSGGSYCFKYWKVKFNRPRWSHYISDSYYYYYVKGYARSDTYRANQRTYYGRYGWSPTWERIRIQR